MLGTMWGVRSNTDSGNEKADIMDDDGVELEKSNILLMGPTGSGNLSLTIF
jgi:ATP-dependent Clp protease ATP-binding subunit ClpX